jgi:hypothetical protein
MARPRGNGVSDSESFINEVTEEVRRDRLFALFRRYAWIGVAVVLVLVGGAAWNEYQKANRLAAAEALGDNLLTALETEDPTARIAALQAVPATGPAQAVTALLTAAQQEQVGDMAGAMATLESLAVNPEVGQNYRDLAQFKALAIGADVLDPAERMAGLEAIAAPGAPYRLLALEQIALSQITAGERDAALATLVSISEDAEVSGSIKQRVDSLLTALGGEVPAAAGPEALTPDVPVEN